jgi:predicted nucleic acid-binding protein
MGMGWARQEVCRWKIARPGGHPSLRRSSKIGEKRLKLGLDTSVVLRLLVGEPEGQAHRAQARLSKALAAGDAICVSDLVVAEAYHALVHHYGVPSAEAEEMLEEMVTSHVVTLEPRSCSEAFGRAGPGFVDRLIASRYRAMQATTLTFDAKLARLPGAAKP